MIRLSIRRPVAVTMAYLGVAVLGVAAWRNIPIELLPNTDLPQLTVEATWRGASPEAMEAFVTSPMRTHTGRRQPRSRWSSSATPIWTSLGSICRSDSRCSKKIFPRVCNRRGSPPMCRTS